MESDEVLESLKDDKQLQEFRQQRFKEIVKDSFSEEHEMYIDQMIEANAMLKLDLEKEKEEKHVQIELANQEIHAISKKVYEIEDNLQQESSQK